MTGPEPSTADGVIPCPLDPPTPEPVRLRSRRDRCPGVFRPWPASDGLLVRLRVPGGQLPSSQLSALSAVATEYGDARVHLTSRANLQVRGLPGAEGRLRPEVEQALRDTGLLPAPSHDLVRNILASPLTGRHGGRVDLRPIVAELDLQVRQSPELAELPGRFLFVLDDGRGDLVARTCDLGAVALDAERAQLRLGDRFGPVVPWVLVPATLSLLARAFLRRRGKGEAVPWHIAEFEATGANLGDALAAPAAPDARVPPPAAPLAHGVHGAWTHHRVPAEGLDAAAVDRLARHRHLVLTPWRGVLAPTSFVEPTTQEIR